MADAFHDALRAAGYAPRFNLLELGARPATASPEPFYPLLERFPGSQLFGFEVDPEACAALNAHAPDGARYFPHAIGRARERRALYQTRHPMCASLYPPRSALIDLYQNLQMMQPTASSEIETVDLDGLLREEKIDRVDFIKVDIQGAELDAFQGAEHTLEETLVIVSEVEFIPLYEGQPLFGDVASFLAERGFMFHKFLGLSGRALRPLVLKNDRNFPSQHMWSDAVFVRDILALDELNKTQILKMAILVDLYGSPDLTYHLLSRLDPALASAYLRSITPAP